MKNKIRMGLLFTYSAFMFAVVPAHAVVLPKGSPASSLKTGVVQNTKSSVVTTRNTDSDQSNALHSGAIQTTGPWIFAGQSGTSNGEISETNSLSSSGPTLALTSNAIGCTTLNSEVQVTASLRDVQTSIVAGQLLMQWQPSKLRLNSVQAGDEPFSVVYNLNQQTGTVMVLTSIPPGSSPAGGSSASPCQTEWKEVATSAPGAYEIAYDEMRHKTVLVSDGKTWEWSGVSWELKSQSGPASRGAGALVYDPNGHRCLLFGGYGGNPAYSDLWSWDGSIWTLLNNNQIPGRGDFAMAFDRIRNRLVVHGGYNGSYLMSDTCEWNPSNNTWNRITNSPIGNLYAHRMVFDESLGKVMLHGGFYYYNRSDTWTWDGANWVRIATNGPARYVFGMAYDSKRGEMVIHGGTTCCGEVEYPTTYRFRNGGWELCNSSGPARGYMGMAYDRSRDALIFSGGMGPSSSGRIGHSETWELRPAPSEVAVARLNFTVLGGACNATGNEVGFFNFGSMKTEFTDGYGGATVPTLLDSAGFVVDDGAPVLSNVPADVTVQAEAGMGSFAYVGLTPPTATDACAPDLTASSSRSDGAALSAAFPVGTTTVTWSATDPCANTTTATTLVTVNNSNTATFAVSYTNSGSYAASSARTLTLNIHGANGYTLKASQPVTLVNGAGTISLTDLAVDNYDCVAVEEKGRSLRRVATMTDGGLIWNSTATLVAGDLINDEVIDVLDWGAYIVGNPNADLDGNGVINATDGNFIIANFGQKGETGCGTSFMSPPEPLNGISVSELVSRGLTDLVGADLNNDGWVDMEDVRMASNGGRMNKDGWWDVAVARSAD